MTQGERYPPSALLLDVRETPLGAEAYMEAFMNGFEFVLLAIRGRLAEGGLPREERDRLEAFLADYARIAQAYHARREAPLEIRGPVRAKLETTAVN